ncbi:MAG: DUF3089 domain-containing protein [Bacteroidota bacterium]
MKSISIWTLGLLLFLGACSSSKDLLTQSFDKSPKWEEPDYSNLDAWCSHPEKEDFADKYPEGVSEEDQEHAAADVFFVHPTTFMKGAYWNANVEDSSLNMQTDERAIMHQASVFNHSCKVYAPRYRQMVYGGFGAVDTASKRSALLFAYQDVRKAFKYYLENFNKGRPIVIAGHSQGALHAQMLLQEFFDGKDLQKQLVAAYVPGWPFRASKFKSIPICDSPDATECVMGWATWKKNAEPKSLNTFYKDVVVVNPINWKTDGSFAPESMHKGYLNAKYSKIKSQSIHAQAHQGILWVKSPLPLAPIKNFHVGDINLFWVDIRENVEVRVNEFIEVNGSEGSYGEGNK